jgi:hypothetical protein
MEESWMGKYDGLTELLMNTAEEVEEITLAFAEIATLIRSELPNWTKTQIQNAVKSYLGINAASSTYILCPKLDAYERLFKYLWTNQPISASKLAIQLGLSPQKTTAMLKICGKEGMVEKKTDGGKSLYMIQS